MNRSVAIAIAALAVIGTPVQAQVQSAYSRLEDATTGNVKDLTNASAQWTVPSLQSNYRICAFGNTAYLLCGDNPTATTSDGGHALIVPEGTCVGPVMLKCADETWNTCSAQNTGDTITKNAHNLAAGSKVQFRGITASGLSDYTIYYVVTPLTNTFQVALTAGGTPIVLGADVASAAYSMVTLDGKCAPRKCAFIAPSTVTGARIEFLQIAPSQK